MPAQALKIGERFQIKTVPVRYGEIVDVPAPGKYRIVFDGEWYPEDISSDAIEPSNVEEPAGLDVFVIPVSVLSDSKESQCQKTK